MFFKNDSSQNVVFNFINYLFTTFLNIYNVLKNSVKKYFSNSKVASRKLVNNIELTINTNTSKNLFFRIFLFTTILKDNKIWNWMVIKLLIFNNSFRRKAVNNINLQHNDNYYHCLPFFFTIILYKILLEKINSTG